MNDYFSVALFAPTKVVVKDEFFGDAVASVVLAVLEALL